MPLHLIFFTWIGLHSHVCDRAFEGVLAKDHVCRNGCEVKKTQKNKKQKKTEQK